MKRPAPAAPTTGSGAPPAKRPRAKPAVPALELPHERDETTEAPVAARKVIKQAAQDVNAGMIDTDNYTRASAVEAAAPGRKRRGR